MQEQRDQVMCARILTSMLSLIKKEENGTPVSIHSRSPACLGLLKGNYTVCFGSDSDKQIKTA